MPSALLWAYSAEKNFLFAVSKLPFHGKGRNGEQALKTADCLCDPCCENGVQESPQTFLNPKIINNSFSPSQLSSTGASGWFSTRALVRPSGRISPAAVSESLVRVGPTSSYTSTENSTTLRTM